MTEGKIGHRILAGRGSLGRIIEVIAPEKKRTSKTLVIKCLLDQLKSHDDVFIVEEEGQAYALAKGKKSHLIIASKCNVYFLKHILPSLQSDPENTIFLIGSDSDTSSFCAHSIIFVDHAGQVMKELPYGLNF